MSGDWPDGWIPATLMDADLPVTDFTKRALLAWNATTPILPYTNNPLGMPAVKGKTSELMRTGYAMFATMPLFRRAFAEFIASPAGHAVGYAIGASGKYSEVWRAVHVLRWPANTTETDWPSGILDLTSQSYRDQASSVDSPADRTTSGAYGTQTAFGNLAGASSRNAADAAIGIQQATKAMGNMPGRLR